MLAVGEGTIMAMMDVLYVVGDRLPLGNDHCPIIICRGGCCPVQMVRDALYPLEEMITILLL
ncbi:hypothetical protein DPMN_029326 [Dreissena polymorpha]|uniref:Uncharacterized protein n=1 Tax=Dreissena polymorpha TaxID=45954 RepID=A0A9D4RF59_DREPO|nr:hypothetical protein DPMN_029326 [Dreissena polymorpha]